MRKSGAAGSGARRGAALVLAGSAALLGGALLFQYGGGLAPCELCIWQRWAHGAAMAGAVLALVLPRGLPAALGLGLALVGLVAGVGIAGFHVGVEQGWWQGLAACGGGGSTAGSVQDLLSQIETAPVVRCGDVAWSLFGLSMAGWNALISLGLGLGALAVARRR
ncbi:disulfide bond formation protein B [Zavarzinia compransoris]|uniref:Disulfide bond formation protein B n=1 Tax=Zavarzinia compransoris TaxID=1264899 RepID=A0A317DWA4_9PROT|nr:disulfide bond formation protein B [Zavarzinia compransoris]PWR18969.1 disulfide bond formation protein B [Zavarzinia compransoris]TDP48970.1 disulfide bond formation protein DsbB [Zavarzinia compransoris]